MRRYIERFKNLSVVQVGFIWIFVMLFTCTLCVVASIEELTDAVRETKEVEQVQQISMDELTANQQQQVMDAVANNEPEEEIVPVYFDNEEYNYNGNMIYTFGDISDEFYFFIFINEEQGIYEYYFPAMHADWPIECESLSELQRVVMTHIDQAYPNATFVMR